jgi:hypothetical protein
MFVMVVVGIVVERVGFAVLEVRVRARFGFDAELNDV